MSHRPPRSIAFPALIAAVALLAGCDVPFAGRLQPTAPVRPRVTVATRVEPATAGTVTVAGTATPYRRGDRIQLTAHAAEGWRFLDWAAEPAGGAGAANPLSLVVTERITITARFGPAAYEVSTAVEGSGRVQVSGVGWEPADPTDAADPAGVVAADTEVTFEAVPAAGHGFSHWEGSTTGTANPVALNAGEPINLTAVFSADQFALSHETVGEGTVVVELIDGGEQHGADDGGTDSTEGLVYGSEVRLTATPAPGWRFLHWDDDPADAANPKTLTVTGSHHLRAVFAANEWTVLLYMNGDNELEPNLLEDLNELEAVDLSNTGVTVVALVDRADGHDTSNGDWRGTRLYRTAFDPNGVNNVLVSQRIASARMGLSDTGDADELNLGSAATLSDFLDFAAAEFPAENTALIFWGHGGGYRAASAPRAPAGGRGAPAGPPDELSALTDGPSEELPVAPAGPHAKPRLSAEGHRAVTVDDGSGGDSLLTPELGSALAGRDIDVLAFDLCYGALLEVAYEVQDSASLFVASQDVVGADGWEYDRFLERFLQSPRDAAGFATAAAEAFETSHAAAHRATISIVDLTRIHGVASALDDLSLALVDWIDLGDARERRAALRDGVFAEVEDFYSTPGDLNIDLRDLAGYLASDLGAAVPEANALDAAVAEAVVHTWAGPGNPDARGLSVHYVPLDALGYPTAHADAYLADHVAAPPLAFVSASQWVPNPSAGSGLLYRLWYEAL
ncbi:MAG: clostripain-related cysteine peptidase [Spirochaetota bacterium]